MSSHCRVFAFPSIVKISPFTTDECIPSQHQKQARARAVPEAQAEPEARAICQKPAPSQKPQTSHKPKPRKGKVKIQPSTATTMVEKTENKDDSIS